MDIPEGRIQADRLDIEFNQARLFSNEPQRVKLYNMAILPQKIQLWLIVGLSLGSLITNLTSIESSFHLLPESNSISTEVLGRINHDPKDPGSLGGVERLLRHARQLHVAGVTQKSVEEYLRSEQDYTLHKPTRRRFTRNHTYVAGIDAQWQADLADMQGIARQNGGMRYLLTVIDVFSKFAWAIPVHSKDAKAITAAFGQVLTTANPRHPQR